MTWPARSAGHVIPSCGEKALKGMGTQSLVQGCDQQIGEGMFLGEVKAPQKYVTAETAVGSGSGWELAAEGTREFPAFTADW